MHKTIFISEKIKSKKTIKKERDILRVLMLSWEFPPKSVGGLARHVNDLSLAMVDQGHEIHIITCAFEGAPLRETKDGVHIYRVHPYSIQTPNFLHWTQHLNFAMLEKAVPLLSSKEFDIIHAHDWLVAFAGRALKHSFRLPLIATIHATECGRNGGLYSDTQRYINSVEWFLTYEAWKVIVCSKHMENEVKSLFGVPGDKVEILPNGIFPHKFKEPPEKGWVDIPYLNNNDRVILFVGRLVQEKGVHILLEAAHKVLHSVPNAKFVIVGKGPMEEHLKHIASSLGDRVHFTGYASDDELKTLYKRAETAVFPSLYEPFGIVALEAMATETPLVVSDTGGLSEIVKHGQNGLKAYPGNANSLADNILAALHDKKLAANLIRHATSSINNKYDWNKIASKTLAIYQDVRSEYEESSWSMPAVAFTEIPERYSLVEERIKNQNLRARGEVH